MSKRQEKVGPTVFQQQMNHNLPLALQIMQYLFPEVKSRKLEISKCYTWICIYYGLHQICIDNHHNMLSGKYVTRADFDALTEADSWHVWAIVPTPRLQKEQVTHVIEMLHAAGYTRPTTQELWDNYWSND